MPRASPVFTGSVASGGSESAQVHGDRQPAMLALAWPRQLQVRAGKRAFNRGQGHLGAWLLPPTSVPQEGLLERLLWGLEREFLNIP